VWRASEEVLTHEFFEQLLACPRVEAQQAARLWDRQRKAGHLEILTDDALQRPIGGRNKRGTVLHAMHCSKRGATRRGAYSVIRLMICAC
jgi:hypothetical protein